MQPLSSVKFTFNICHSLLEEIFGYGAICAPLYNGVAILSRSEDTIVDLEIRIFITRNLRIRL